MHDEKFGEKFKVRIWEGYYLHNKNLTRKNNFQNFVVTTNCFHVITYIEKVLKYKVSFIYLFKFFSENSWQILADYATKPTKSLNTSGGIRKSFFFRFDIFFARTSPDLPYTIKYPWTYQQFFFCRLKIYIDVLLTKYYVFFVTLVLMFTLK